MTRQFAVDEVGKILPPELVEEFASLLEQRIHGKSAMR